MRHDPKCGCASCTTTIVTIPLTILDHRWIQLMIAWNASWGGCSVCGTSCYGPILKPKVWHRVAKTYSEVLCRECMEKRLGRKLLTKDVDPCPWNTEREDFFNTLRGL